MGLMVSVGGTCTIGGSYRFIASAQTPEELDRRIEAVLARAYERDLAAGLSEDAAQANREREMQRLLTNPSEIDAFEAVINGEIEEVRQVSAGESAIIRALDRLRTSLERASSTQPAQQNRGTVGRQTIMGNTMLQVKGTNHIEAWSDTHIHSLSNNDLMHEGNGGVNIDRGDVVISDFSNSQETRDVTVNEANSLTVAPGITMRAQNGTEFTMGATALETLENLQRAMGLTNQGPTAAAQLKRSCIYFIVSLYNFAVSFLLGRWLGGSGGSN